LTGIFDWGCSLAGDFIYDIAWFTFWAPWHPGLDTIDIRSRVVGHYATLGFNVPDFAERLRCYELHIALEHLAYSAAIGRTETLATLADVTRRLL
jgi:hygromycin-B 4-O-kinase